MILKDEYNSVEIELADKLFIQLEIEAHEANRTLNEHINTVLREVISRGQELKDSNDFNYSSMD